MRRRARRTEQRRVDGGVLVNGHRIRVDGRIWTAIAGRRNDDRQEPPGTLRLGKAVLLD